MRPTAPIRTLLRRRHRERGMITLFDLILAMVVFGVLSAIYSGQMGTAFAAFDIAQDEEQEALNKRLASVLLDYAATVSPIGKLPAPYTLGTTKNAILDDADTELQALLVEARINPREANGDGTGKDYVRVYQRASDLTTNVPLYGATGPAITLTYQEAVILSTHCQRADTCNTTGTGGIPGFSGKFDSTNLTTYAVTDDDFGLARISTLSLQKHKLSRTVDNIDAIRTRLQELFRERQRQAAASDTSNFYPRQITTVAAAAVGPTTDCHNGGWYRLDNSDILKQIGLNPSEYGVNAWGGQIHYCPDYDALGTAGADAPPHFAALRILKTPSDGASPEIATGTHLTKNIVISF
jgi:hypothetical protein